MQVLTPWSPIWALKKQSIVLWSSPHPHPRPGLSGGPKEPANSCSYQEQRGQLLRGLLVTNSDAVSQVLPSASESALEGQRAVCIAWPLHSRSDSAESPRDRNRGRRSLGWQLGHLSWVKGDWTVGSALSGSVHTPSWVQPSCGWQVTLSRPFLRNHSCGGLSCLVSGTSAGNQAPSVGFRSHLSWPPAAVDWSHSPGLPPSKAVKEAAWCGPSINPGVVIRGGSHAKIKSKPLIQNIFGGRRLGALPAVGRLGPQHLGFLIIGGLGSQRVTWERRCACLPAFQLSAWPPASSQHQDKNTDFPVPQRAFPHLSEDFSLFS